MMPTDRIIGVVKAFSTCVGDGPFPTEMGDKEAPQLREQATNTAPPPGAPGGWATSPWWRPGYGAEVQSVTELAVTKLDCLSRRGPLPVCTHYEYKGRPIHEFPINALLESVRPVYRELPGWDQDITALRRFEDLPGPARDYVSFIESSIGRRIRYVDRQGGGPR